MYSEIPITAIENVLIGHSSDKEGGTGCTVILTPDGAAAGLDVRGGGPASRESELLRPTAAADVIHAVLLAGGSAYGLDAAGGVMKYLEEQGVGVDVGVARVPLVCQSNIFDLDYRSSLARPDSAMGYEACEHAAVQATTGKAVLESGSVGAGTGATIGKMQGPGGSEKSGVGHFAIQVGSVKIGAVAVVNALGDVYDIDTGDRIGGMHDISDPQIPISSEHTLIQSLTMEGSHPLATEHSNTTLGVIVTNVALDKTAMNKVAAMAQNGLARTIRPVHTSFDGDSVYALSVGGIEPSAMATDTLGTLGAYVMGRAIGCAVKSGKLTKI